MFLISPPFTENKSKNRFDCIQTMADAKIALKHIFETASVYLNEFHKDKKAKETALHELQETYDIVTVQLQEKEKLLKEEVEKLKKTEVDHQDKVTFYFNN